MTGLRFLPVIFGQQVGGVTYPSLPITSDLVLYLEANRGVDFGAVSEIGTWADQSGNGIDFEASGTPPGITAGPTLNGITTVDGRLFDATESASAWKFLSDGSEYHIFAVVRFTSGGADGLCGTCDASTNEIGMWAQSTASEQVAHGVARSGGTPNSPIINISSSSIFTVGDWFIFEIAADPDNATAANRSTMRVDDGTAQQNNSYTNTPSASNPKRTLNIGAAGTAFSGNTQLAEFLVYDAKKGDVDRAAIISYLQSKYAL